MIKFPNMIKLLVVLAMVCSLVAIVAAPASAALGIALSVNTGAVGTSVTITATDFAPSTILTAKFDGAVVTTAPTTVTADTGGDATFAIAIPASTAGAHTILVTDGVKTAIATFTVFQKVAITVPATKQGPVGT